MEKEKKELNLVDVFAAIGRGIKNLFVALWNAFVWCLRFMYRKKWITLMFVVLGCAAGAGMYYGNGKQKAGFYLRSTGESTYHCIETVNLLGRGCSKKLGLADSQDDGISSFKAYHVVDMWLDGNLDGVDYKKKYASDTLVKTWSPEYFYVEVKAKRLDNLAVLRDSLISYLSADPIMRAKWNLKKRNIEKTINAFYEDMARLDSVEERLYTLEYTNGSMQRSSQNQINVLSGNSVQVFTDYKLRMYDQILIFEEKLDALNNGIVYSELPIYYKGPGTSLTVYIVGFGILGWIAGLLLCLLFQYWGSFIEFLKKE